MASGMLPSFASLFAHAPFACATCEAEASVAYVDVPVDERAAALPALVDDRPAPRVEAAASAEEALERLMEGNARHLARRSSGQPKPTTAEAAPLRDDDCEARPSAVVVGCVDARCRTHAVFDAPEGDVLVLTNVGNSCQHPNSSGLTGSVEYAVGAMDTPLIVVMGHTRCEAIRRATLLWLGSSAGGVGVVKRHPTMLERSFVDLACAAGEAAEKLGEGGTLEEIAALAVRTNVWTTIRKLFKHSVLLRERARSGRLQLHGAIYDQESGHVDFLGQHPQIDELLSLEPKSSAFPRADSNSNSVCSIHSMSTAISTLDGSANKWDVRSTS